MALDAVLDDGLALDADAGRAAQADRCLVGGLAVWKVLCLCVSQD